MTDAELRMLELRRAAYAVGLAVSNIWVFSNLEGIGSEERERAIAGLNERIVEISQELGLD